MRGEAVTSPPQGVGEEFLASGTTHFQIDCCFPVIYLNPNISSLQPNGTHPEASAETIQLTPGPDNERARAPRTGGQRS